MAQFGQGPYVCQLWCIIVMQGRMSTRWRQLLILSINQLASASFVVKRGLNFRTSIVLFSCWEQNCECWFHHVLSVLTFLLCLVTYWVIDWDIEAISPFTHYLVSAFLFFGCVYDDEWPCYRYKIKLREQQEQIRNQRKSQVSFILSLENNKMHVD